MASTKLTSEEKMKLWHEGQRKQNVKQMGDDKLQLSYEICVNMGYTKEADILKAEMDSRSGGMTRAQVETYVENFENESGCGWDLYKMSDADKSVYSWSAEMDANDKPVIDTPDFIVTNDSIQTFTFDNPDVVVELKSLNKKLLKQILSDGLFM